MLTLLLLARTRGPMPIVCLVPVGLPFPRGLLRWLWAGPGGISIIPSILQSQDSPSEYCKALPSLEPASALGHLVLRGPHRRGVAAGRGRAAYCDQGHRARPGAPGPVRRGALPPRPADRRSLPLRTRKESPAPPGPGTSSGRTLKGQTPVQPGLRSRHSVATAPPSASPPRPRPQSTLGAGPGAGRR